METALRYVGSASGLHTVMNEVSWEGGGGLMLGGLLSCKL